MSNALKARKKKMKPRGFEDTALMKRIAENKTLSDKCFCSVFTSMQMISFTVLYDYFDFEKDKLEEYNENLRRHNNEYSDDGLTATYMALQHLKNYGFDVNKAARNFPYRPKIKMLGIETKGMKKRTIALESVNAAIEGYLVLALHTLHEDYQFTKEDVNEWWEHLVSVSELYVKGMTDKFVEQYFKDECNLVITE